MLLYLLFDRPMRLSELSRARPEISQKVLIQQLREMPPRVEYSATPLGRSLEPVLLALCTWGRQHATALDELDRLRDCEAPVAAQASDPP